MLRHDGSVDRRRPRRPAIVAFAVPRRYKPAFALRHAPPWRRAAVRSRAPFGRGVSL